MTHASSTHYDFVVAAGRALASKDRPRVLDFGCGLGQVVERGVAAGLDMVGVDTFEGQLSNWRDEIPPHIADRIHCIAGPLPFPDASFDVVITNQVFEHIADPRTVLPEIRRVLKTGGAFLAPRQIRFNAVLPDACAPMTEAMPVDALVRTVDSANAGDAVVALLAGETSGECWLVRSSRDDARRPLSALHA